MEENQGSNDMDIEGFPSQDNDELDIMINLFKEEDEQEQLKTDVINLGVTFFKDMGDRIHEMDLQYLTGLKILYSLLEYCK